MPVLSHDCTCMSPFEAHPARTNCVWLAGSRSLIPLPPPFLKSLCSCFFSLLLLFIYPCIHLFIHPPSQLSAPFSLGLVQKQITSCVLSLSLSVFTPLSIKLNKELNQGHHLWLLCASMIQPSASAWAFKGPYPCFCVNTSVTAGCYHTFFFHTLNLKILSSDLHLSVL